MIRDLSLTENISCLQNSSCASAKCIRGYITLRGCVTLISPIIEGEPLLFPSLAAYESGVRETEIE